MPLTVDQHIAEAERLSTRVQTEHGQTDIRQLQSLAQLSLVHATLAQVQHARGNQ